MGISDQSRKDRKAAGARLRRAIRKKQRRIKKELEAAQAKAALNLLSVETLSSSLLQVKSTPRPHMPLPEGITWRVALKADSQIENLFSTWK